jgi:hypothetical protein
MCYDPQMPDAAERRARLSIDVSTATRRRIRLAAARRDQSIRDYVVEALTERLREDLGDEQPDQGGALTEETDPVLGHLWRNALDSAYDDL